jgi:hypothetical protein
MIHSYSTVYRAYILSLDVRDLSRVGSLEGLLLHDGSLMMGIRVCTAVALDAIMLPA